MLKTLLLTVLTVGLLAGTAEDAHAHAHAQEAMLLFGGEGNRTFLGCLNCGNYENTSVQNKFGDYGSEYSDKSIFNKYSSYGSPYSEYSVCNKYADKAPVIVDKDGQFYGRLSSNPYAQNVIQNAQIRAWLAAICQP